MLKLLFLTEAETQFDDDRLGSSSKENSVLFILPLVSTANIQDKQDPTRPQDVSDRDTELSIKKKATSSYLSLGHDVALRVCSAV
jgi:hypothetical protein